MKMVSTLRRLKKAIQISKAVFKFGGVNSVRICQVDWGNVLVGKTVLITGAGSGIGLAIARKCVKCGAKVIITGRNENKLKDAIREMNSNRASYMVWDISEIEKIPMKLMKCLEEHGNIDILINNAGVQPKAFFPEVTEVEWDRIYGINSKGTFFLTEAICKYWMENVDRDNYRKIINIDSQGGFVGATYPYRMSKWDIRGFTKGLGLKMAPYGVLVNGIAPGVVKTEMQQFSMEQGENTYCDQNPIERVCLAEEVAELAAYMMSDACNFMVGQTILMDGGFSLN